MTSDFGNFVPKTRLPKYVMDQAFWITFLGWIIELLTIQGKYSEVPNRRACSLRYFRFFSPPCLFKNLKYFLPAHLFCTACLEIYQVDGFLTSLISSSLSVRLLDCIKNSILLFYIFSKKMSVCLLILVCSSIRDFK